MQSAVSCIDEGAAAAVCMKGAFTRYLRLLGPRKEPEPEAFDEVWRALRAALAHELRKRSLWTSPPGYVGVHGWESWESRGPDDRQDALDELAVDCYGVVFVQRLPGLLVHLGKKPNVEGLVFLLIRNFLYDRQRRHDPLGFRVFEVLRCAVHEAVAAGELFVLAGDAEIRNATVLSARGPRGGVHARAEQAEFVVLARRWNEELLPDLVTAVGSARPPLVARLRRRLLDLEAEGVGVFRFKDLLAAVKNDVRQRWAAVFDVEEGEQARGRDVQDDASFVAAVRLVQPDRGCEEKESYDKLVSCVTDLLEKVDASRRTRHYLRALWGFLRSYACGQGPERLPSNRKLAGLLRIPRERFPELYAVLRQLSRRCVEGFCASNVIDGRNRFTGTPAAARGEGRPS